MAVAILTVLFGFLVGAYGTLVGAGGGFLMVPALLVVLGARPEQAAGTSLVVVFFNAVSGTVSYARQRRIDYRAGWRFALATLPGAAAGAFASRFLGGRAFAWVFGGLLLVISGYLLWRPVLTPGDAGGRAPAGRFAVEREVTDAGGHTFRYRYDEALGLALSAVVGFLSSLLGIGGGIIHVPAMVQLLGFPAHIATATSHFILIITAAVGAGTHVALGHVIWQPVLPLALGVVGGAQVGAMIAPRLKGPLVVRLLALALVAVALRLLVI